MTSYLYKNNIKIFDYPEWANGLRDELRSHAEQIKRLGSPYYSAKEKGTGLGTMVSFGIIKKMNGRIQIESEVGKGTEFTLVFPEDKGRNS